MYYFFCRSREDVYLDNLKAFILLVAVKNQLRDTVMRLLENRVSSKDSPEINSCEHASIVASSLASRFIKNDFDDGLVPELKKNRTQIPLFSWALQCGHVEVVNLLILEETSWTDDSGFGLSMLGLACLGGHEPVVQLILEKGADLEMKDNRGYTALHLAASKGHQAVVRLLLREGANIEAYDYTSRYEMRVGKTEPTYFINMTALHFAAKDGNSEMVQLLLNEGAKIEICSHGTTALLLAAKGGKSNTVQLLLNEGASIETISNALRLAADAGNPETVQLLLDAGADVGLTDSDGWSALHRAAEHGHMAVAELLVCAGADIAGRTAKGVIALHVLLLNHWTSPQFDTAFYNLLRQQLQPSDSMPHSQISFCRTQVDIEFESIRAEFILDSRFARIEYTEAVPSNVYYKDSQIICFRIGKYLDYLENLKDIDFRSSHKFPRLYSHRTKMRFSIVHPEGSPLDFSVGRGGSKMWEPFTKFSFKVRILNWEWEKIFKETDWRDCAHKKDMFHIFRDVLSIFEAYEKESTRE